MPKPRTISGRVKIRWMKDDDDLLQHHQQPGPGKEPADRIGEPLQHPHTAPHEAVFPQADTSVTMTKDVVKTTKKSSTEPP